eukprot:c13839_g1_i1 orf=374-1120(-)
MERMLVHSLVGTGATLCSSSRPARSPVCCLPPPWSLIDAGSADRSGLFQPSKLGLSSINASRDSVPPSPTGNLWNLQEDNEVKALVHVRKEDGLAATSKVEFETLSKDMAMGLVLRAASGTGWTTGSGLEGPSNPFELNDGQLVDEAGKFRWPSLSKSPRRRMRVAFTCNVCSERTTRAINPHAYTDGTVFVQCAGCNIFHKLVDNLNLFHELQGSVFPNTAVTYGSHPGFNEHQSYDFLGLDDFSAL